MNARTKFSYMAFGAGLMFLGMLLTLMSPLRAQRDKFGEIECTKLTVVDADGKARVILGTEPIGILEIEATDDYVDDNIRVRVIGDEHGGYVVVSCKDGRSAALSSFTGRGGHVGAYGQRKSVSLGIDEHGGLVAAYGKGKSVSLGINEHGGLVHVKGKSEGAVIMDINEFGNGAVSTWDKNGYRQ